MKLKTFVRQIAAIACAWAALGLAPAQAGVLHATGYLNPPPLQFGLATGATSNGSPTAGAFIGTFDSVPIVFFCAELGQTFGFGNSYTYSMTELNTPTGALLGRLFTQRFGSIVDPSTSAAFQLAVWGILFDADLDIGNPTQFHVTSGNGPTITMAQNWLNTLGAANGFTVYLLENDIHQNFVMAVRKPLQVPEPAPVMLLGGALLAMFLVRRRVADSKR